MGIPEIESSKGSELLPAQVAEHENPETTPDPESKRYKISFDKYIVDECGVNNLDGDYAKSVIRVVKDIGLSFNGTGIVSSENPWIEPIYKDSNRAKNEYAVFYKGIDYDAEIKEVKVVKAIKVLNPKTGKRESKEIDYRIFFYVTPNDSTFHVRAITDDHKNTRKPLPRSR